jgi:hypothetical protein
MRVKFSDVIDPVSATALNRVYHEVTKGKKTRTRERIDALIDPLRARGVGRIDTNADRNELAGGSKGVAPNGDVLKLLLTLPSLKVVIAHGKHARMLVQDKVPPGALYCGTRFSRESNLVREDVGQKASRALSLL